MFTLLSSIIGFLGSTLPHVFKMFQDKQDKAHELAILQLQMEYAKLGIKEDLVKTQISANTDEFKTLYSTYDTGIRWVDALNGCVRPIIAYAFFITYFLTKIPVLYLAIHSPTFGTFNQLWGTEDSCIFAGIISFYFGSRAMQKFLK